MVSTTDFADLTRSVAETLGVASARCAVVPHPLGDRDTTAVARLAAEVTDDIAALLTR